MEGQTSGSDLTGTEEDLRELAIRQLRRKREFRDHLGWFILINAVLWVIWALPPDSANTDDIWPAWVTGIWGVFLLSQGWRVHRVHEALDRPPRAAAPSRKNETPALSGASRCA